MKGIVDRIEGAIIILEIGEDYLEVPIDEFPKGIKEGDIVLYEKNGYRILSEETKRRKEEMEDLLTSLFKKQIKG